MLISAQRLEQEITCKGRTATAVEIDVMDDAAIRRMLGVAISRFGHVDCLVNNAGMLGPLRPSSGPTDEEVDRVFALNVRSVFTCTRRSPGI